MVEDKVEEKTGPWVKAVSIIVAAVAGVGGGSFVIVTEAELQAEIGKINEVIAAYQRKEEIRHAHAEHLIRYFRLSVEIDTQDDLLTESELRHDCFDETSCQKTMQPSSFKGYHSINRRLDYLKKQRDNLVREHPDIIEVIP
jgi:hypothetical protein